MKNTNYKYKEIKDMMEKNYISSQHFSKRHCKMQKNNNNIYQLVITNILMGMIQSIHVVKLK